MFTNKSETKLITLEHYSVIFKTIDGETHKCTKLNYINDDYNISNEFMKDLNYIEDDDGTRYPINNIISIKFLNDDTIFNVKDKQIGYIFLKIWYEKSEIEIDEMSV